jgi:DNA-binding beta-propeller fold protein YncE
MTMRCLKSIASLVVGSLLAQACSSGTEPTPACSGTGAVTPTHPSGAVKDSVQLGLRPYGVTVAACALVTQLDGESVTRIQLAPLSIIDTVSVGAVPTGIASNAAGSTALVTNQHDFTVGIIDIASGTQTKTLSAISNTFRAIFNSTGTRAYVTQSSGPVLAIDMAQQAIVGSVASVSLANGVALSGDTLLIVTSTNGQIAYIDTRTLTETKRITGGGIFQDVAVSNNGTEFYVAVENGPSIEVRSVATGALISTISVGGGTFGLAVSPDGAQLWATIPQLAFGNGRVSVIDLATRAVVRTIPALVPRRVGFDRGGTTAVVSDEAGWVYFIR